MQIYKYLQNKLRFSLIFSNCKAHKKLISLHITLSSLLLIICVSHHSWHAFPLHCKHLNLVICIVIFVERNAFKRWFHICCLHTGFYSSVTVSHLLLSHMYHNWKSAACYMTHEVLGKAAFLSWCAVFLCFGKLFPLLSDKSVVLFLKHADMLLCWQGLSPLCDLQFEQHIEICLVETRASFIHSCWTLCAESIFESCHVCCWLVFLWVSVPMVTITSNENACWLISFIKKTTLNGQQSSTHDATLWRKDPCHL